MIKRLILILVFGLVLIIAGCAPECSRNSDCTAKPGFSAKCSEGKCVQLTNPNTCGNTMCENPENSCTCPSDCGACQGKEGRLEKSCNSKKECVLSLSDATIKEASFTQTLDIRVASLDVRYSYPQPFDVTRHLFETSFSLGSKQDDVTKITINKVRLLEVDRTARSTKLFGEADSNQFLWDPTAKIEAQLPLFPQLQNSSGEEKTVELEINYEYTLKSGNTIRASIKKELPARMLFVKSQGTPQCPVSCDDANACTVDTCSAESNYFCTHTLTKAACCGNTVCDGNENECSCNKDCGSCERTFGKYMAYSCQSNECIAGLTDPSAVKPKTLIIQTQFSEFTIENKVSFEDPFNIKQSKFTIVSEINNIREGVSSIKCTKLQILDNTELLSEKTVAMTYANNLDKLSNTLQASFTTRDPELTKTPQLKLFCEYDKTIGQNKQHYTQGTAQSLGTIVFINPG